MELADLHTQNVYTRFAIQKLSLSLTTKSQNSTYMLLNEEIKSIENNTMTKSETSAALKEV